LNLKKAMVAGIAAAGLLLTAGQPHNVLAEQPPFFQYKGEKLRATQIAQYDSLAGLGGTEILAYDEKLKRAFVTNGAESAIDILSFEALKSGEFTNVESLKRLYLKDFGIKNVTDITSVAAHPTEDIIALSVVSKPKTDSGYIVLLTKTGDFITQVKVGVLPDMVAFTPDGTKLLSANEGEPSDDYTVDPEGTISIIDLTVGLDSLTVQTLSFEGVELDKNVRVGSKGTVLQQLEPEYIAISPDSKRAFVALQENNAVATVNLETNTIMHVKGFSLGMKQRLGIATALLGNPELLILDEPTNGLDPSGIIEIRELIKSLPKKHGITIVISSHLLSEIDQMATQVGIISKGQMIFQDSITSLRAQSTSKIKVTVNDGESAWKTLLTHGYKTDFIQDKLVIENCADQNVAEIVKSLVQNDYSIYRVEEERKSLEEIFLELTGQEGGL